MSGGTLYAFGAYRLDPAEKVLYRDGTPVALTPKAFDTLAVLVECHPRLATKDDLLARVWPGTFVEDNNLAQYVSLLRRTLADLGGADPVIETVPRRGYRFRPSVVRIDPSAPAATSPPAPAAVEPATTPAAASRRWLAAAAAAGLLTVGVAGRGFLGGGTADPPPVSIATARDSEAHLAYLGGQAAFAQGYSDTANQARARADVERSVALDPGFAPAWALLARIYGVQYRTAMDRDPAILDAAERAARTAVTIDPQLAAGHLALADVYYTRRDHVRARTALDAGRAVLTGEAHYWYLRAFMAQREGHWREAETALASAFDLDGPATAEWLAVQYLHLRSYADARRVLAVAHASSRPAAVVPEAWTTFSERGDVAGARPGLEVALGARTPPDARVLGLLAQFEWFDGRDERALELIGQMDAAGAWLAPNFRYPAAIAAADVLDGLGRRAEARALYTEAVTFLEARRLTDPDDAKVIAALGLAHAGLGNADEAVRLAQRAVALMPRERDAGEGPLYLYLLARVHARLGQAAQATRVLDTMFEAPSFYSEAWVARDPSFAALRAEETYDAHFEHWATRKGEVLLTRAGDGRRDTPAPTPLATLGQQAMAAPTDDVPADGPARSRPIWILLAIPAAALAYLPAHAGLLPQGRHALFVLLLSAALWVSGALPPFAVSLLAIALHVALLGDPAGAFADGDPRRWEMFVAPWASPVMWLFLAGLTLGSAAAGTGLDRRLALSVLGVVGHTPRRVLLGVMAVAFVLSMFMSNTAAAALMVAIVTPMTRWPGAPAALGGRLLLGVAAAANLGGMGTVIGTPPNALAAAALSAVAPVDYLRWLTLGLPPALLLAGVGYWWLAATLPAGVDLHLPADEPIAAADRRRQRLLAAIFVGTLVVWVTERLHGVPTAVVAVMPIALLAVTRLVGEAEFRTLPWDVLALIAGGLSLGVGVTETGLGAWLVGGVAGLPPLAAAAVLAAVAAGLSNVMSNTAAAAIVMPMALVLGGASPVPVVVSVALATSTAMCLPVSTPPNALVCTTGLVTRRDLLHLGWRLGAVGLPLVLAWVWMAAPPSP
ncbi:MAG: DASS family sodium-coupled anion symporter [Vicinamibacterales bacterium]